MSEEQTPEQVEEVVETPEVETEELSGLDKLRAAAESADPDEVLADVPDKEEGVVEEEEVEEETEEAAAPEFTPDFKFKVMDQEHEIDEWARDIVKDEETQKSLKELYEKAHGLDFVKEKYAKTKEDYTGLQGKYDQVVESIKGIAEAVDSGEMDAAFQKLGIPQEKVYQWVQRQLEYQELPEEQRQQIEAQRAATAREREMEQKLRSTEAQVQQSQIDAINREVDYTFQQESVQQFATQFDARVGKPKAFEDEVRLRGDNHWRSTGVVKPVHELVKEVMGLYGGVAQPQAEAAPQSATAPENNVVEKPKSHTIPKVKGKGGASPVKELPKSLDDLRALQKQMASQ